jgi:hypothetical protein
MTLLSASCLGLITRTELISQYNTHVTSARGTPFEHRPHIIVTIRRFPRFTPYLWVNAVTIVSFLTLPSSLFINNLSSHSIHLLDNCAVDRGR